MLSALDLGVGPNFLGLTEVSQTLSLLIPGAGDPHIWPPTGHGILIPSISGGFSVSDREEPWLPSDPATDDKDLRACPRKGPES